MSNDGPASTLDLVARLQRALELASTTGASTELAQLLWTLSAGHAPAAELSDEALAAALLPLEAERAARSRSSRPPPPPPFTDLATADRSLDAIEDITAREDAAVALLRAKESAETANRELDAFSYSVAHDLRAPLRSIDGFSQALLEDYTDKLDEEGRSHLRRVRNAAERMALLIDDLHKLSRLTRTELRRERIDLTALGRNIGDKLFERFPDRAIELRVAEGLSADADLRLMSVVIENLLDNAWKFTRSRAPARIELGIEEVAGQPAFYVRDNGVGFDMTYVDKLFGAFQRLHSTEYEGAGIGLAAVQRIVNRHGGRAWADGELDKGAVFRFTLG